MRGMCPSHVLFFRYLRHTHQTAIITHWTKEGAQLSLPLWLCIAQTQHAKLNQECTTTRNHDLCKRPHSKTTTILCVVFQNQKLLGAAHVSFFYLEMRRDEKEEEAKKMSVQHLLRALCVRAQPVQFTTHRSRERRAPPSWMLNKRKKIYIYFFFLEIYLTD